MLAVEAQSSAEPADRDILKRISLTVFDRLGSIHQQGHLARM